MYQISVLVLYATLFQGGHSSGGYEMPFSCQATTTTDQNRQDVLTLINEIRSQVARGQFKAKNSLQSARNMLAMKWDCDLEAVAEQSVRSCPQSPTPLASSYGSNYAFFGPGSYSFVRNHSNQIAVLQWIHVRDFNWPTNNVFSGHPALRSFSNLIRSTTSAVGCAINTCGGDHTAVACVFSQPNAVAGTLLYTSGNPCQNDEDCAASSPAYCESGLCFNAARSTATETTSYELAEPVIV